MMLCYCVHIFKNFFVLCVFYKPARFLFTNNTSCVLLFQGDSGGPLQVFREDPYCMYSLIGITSFGIGCGDQEVNNFNIYVRVFYYIPWIESIVWPGET